MMTWTSENLSCSHDPTQLGEHASPDNMLAFNAALSLVLEVVGALVCCVYPMTSWSRETVETGMVDSYCCDGVMEDGGWMWHYGLTSLGQLVVGVQGVFCQRCSLPGQ